MPCIETRNTNPGLAQGWWVGILYPPLLCEQVWHLGTAIIFFLRYLHSLSAKTFGSSHVVSSRCAAGSDNCECSVICSVRERHSYEATYRAQGQTECPTGHQRVTEICKSQKTKFDPFRNCVHFQGGCGWLGFEAGYRALRSKITLILRSQKVN